MKGVSAIIGQLILVIIAVAMSALVFYFIYGLFFSRVNQNFANENVIGHDVLIRNIGPGIITSVTVIDTQTGQVINSYIDASWANPSNVLYSSNFAGGATGWTPNPAGSWTILNGKYRSDSTASILANSTFKVN